MKKLKYSIKRNNKEIIHSTSNYILNNDIIMFYYNKIKIIIDKQKKSFTRETKEDRLYISNKDSFILLKSKNIKFNIDLINYNFDIINNNIIISYTIAGDDEIVEIFILL